MNGRALGTVAEQRDLGVQALFLQCGIVGRLGDKRAFGTLAFISLGVEYGRWDIKLQLYSTSVRPNLEYFIQFQSLCCREDVIRLEGVQRRCCQDLRD